MNIRAFLTLALVGVLAGAAAADVMLFDNSGGDGQWGNGANWKNNTAGTYGALPVGGDDTRVTGTAVDVEIGPGVLAEGGTIRIGWYAAGTNNVTMNGGALTTSGIPVPSLDVGYGGGTGSFVLNDGVVTSNQISIGANATGTFTQNGGSVGGLAGGANGLLRLGAFTATATGTYNMNGGVCTAPDMRVQGGKGYVNMTGGTFDLGTIYLGFIGGNGSMVMSDGLVQTVNTVIGAADNGSNTTNYDVTMTGGTWNAASVFHVGRDQGVAHFQLDGGTVSCADFGLSLMAWPGYAAGVGTMDITGAGTLIITPVGSEEMSVLDHYDRVVGYRSSGILTAYGDPGLVDIAFDGSTITVTAIPEPATLLLLGLGGLAGLRRRR